ncbi:MAG TPA: hypothetical protein VF476_03200 [Chitinophagaceae bacterium]
MDTEWQSLLTKVEDGKQGLLRFTDSGKRRSLAVEITSSDMAAALLHCACNKDNLSTRLTNRPASLTQVSEKGYLLFSGFVTSFAAETALALKFVALQAHWFERKGNGSNKWLQETASYG